MDAGRRLLVTLMLIFPGFPFTAATPAHASDGLAAVTGLENLVQLRIASSQAWNPAALGIAVNTGDGVQTGPRSKAEITYNDGTIIRLASSCSMVIVDQERRILKLLLGKIWAKVTKGSRGMSVHTPAAVASITGTEFFLEVMPDQSTHLTVLEGTVLMFPLQAGPGINATGPDQNSQPASQPTTVKAGETKVVTTNRSTDNQNRPTTAGNQSESESNRPQSIRHAPAGDNEQNQPVAGPPSMTGPRERSGVTPPDNIVGAPPTGPFPRRMELDENIGFGPGGGPRNNLPTLPIEVMAGQAAIARPEIPFRPAFQANPDLVRFQEAPLMSGPLANSVKPPFQAIQVPTVGGPVGQPLPPTLAGPAPGNQVPTQTQLQNLNIDPKSLKGSPTSGIIEVIIR